MRIFSTAKISKQEAVDNVNLADPFAALDVDEYGANVCLHRDDIDQLAESNIGGTSECYQIGDR